MTADNPSRRRLLRLLAVVLPGIVACHASAGGTAAGAPGLDKAGGQGPGEPREGSRVTVVELDVYSGRPNPVWQLSTGQTAALLQMLDALAPAPSRGMPEGLGYRGLIVSVNDPAAPAALRVRVYGGLVRAETKGESTYLADRNRQVERFLVETGRPHIDHDLYAQVAREARIAGSRE